ncbi:hypothetical protein KC19_1G262600 [Ceratodon purpureus]|uniref:Uncharacterized protein n=1 Tax=Ceratodon purpureus TaxID=3225 RepID=A0A8T0JAM9_CERPU|nr:hypothetical protein KC19_1G262600 [Ceratodon purpureus]
MAAKTQVWCLLFMCLAAVAAGRMIVQEGGSACDNLNVKKVTYVSPPLTAMPGEVNNKFFPAMFPKGHIGIKSLNADLVYQNGEPVPLSDIYLHHWVMLEFGVPKEKAQKHLGHLLRKMRRHHKHHMTYDDATAFAAFEAPSHHHHRFHGDKKAKVMNFMGKGGETRHTETRLPGPYVMESGNPGEGYETVWTLNVHGLDTRGTVNKEGCAECRCHLFNATTDEDGKPLPEGYIGGLRCCGDGNQCAVKEGFNGGKNTFHLRYEWEYIDWNECLIPTKSIGIDITNHNGYDENLVEFTVEGCGDADPTSDECLDTREATMIAPIGGEIVYTVSHLHASTLDAAVYGEDGRLICRTTPMYGQGEEAGNEKNYVVGIKSCYGNPGTPNAERVEQGEKLRYVVQSTKVGGPHTGLMGLNGIKIVADGVKADI